MTLSLKLPANNWQPRWYQARLWNHLIQGGKRSIAIWHRRAGKDDVALNYTACAAHLRIGNYWHCLPEYSQGRKAIWTAVNPHTGRRRVDDAFPHVLRDVTNDNEMFIRFKNGSTWQVIGSDRYDATMGSSVVGVTYSEWALAHPGAWGYHRPILEENNGWGLFITTPRGRNHAKAMFDMAMRSEGWFADLKTVHETHALSKKQLDASLEEYVALFGKDVGLAQYKQEYECDFSAAILGAFYALEMMDVRREGRIAEIEPDYDRPVHRAWDIGVRDDTAIWWFQVCGSQLFVLDVYGASNVGLEHYEAVIAERRRKYGWRDGADWVPHDAKVKEWGSGRTRLESMSALGLKPSMVPHVSKLDGINALRRSLPLIVFHPRCEAVGIAALEQYRREWDDELKAFKNDDMHDWTSHYADAARYMALAWRSLPAARVREVKPSGWVIPPPDEARVRRYGEIRL